MDRSWIFGKQFTPAYLKGVEEFMKFVRERYPEDTDIRCPCRKCLNQRVQHQHDVENHIHIFGMSATYTTWIHHGEPADTIEVENTEHQVVEGDHDYGIHVDVEDDGHLDEDLGVPEMIGDLYAQAEADGEQPRFARVLEDAKKALSPGSRHSKFSFMVRMLYIKSRYRISNASTMMNLISSGYPMSELPNSYDEAKKYLRELGLGYENIHVCKNNCVLFRDSKTSKYAKLNVCPVCKESRWKDKTGTKQVPHKVLRHFPLLPRLKRIYASKRTSEETKWHKKVRTPVDNVMSHPADGDAWKYFDSKEKSFAADPRNLRLALATDGFNPFGNMSTQYSMWPVLLTPLNLPPWECVNPANCFMSLLIPGRKSPGKDFDVFLEPLIEELLELWKGVSTYDACTGRKFDLRAAVLWCIHDYPALSTLSGRTTKGYYACIYCDKDPLSRAIRNKICYIGHRRYLPKSHAWRRSLAFDGKRENKDAPQRFTLAEVLEELEKVKDVRPGKQVKEPETSGKKRKRNVGPKIYSRKSALWRLPYWKHLKLPHNLDVMHIEKNICENLLCTLLNVPGKTKDTHNARLDLYDMGIRHHLHLQEKGNNSVSAPSAPYVLGKDRKVEFCKFLKGIKFPDGYAANLARYISEDGARVVGLKTHSCHILLQRIIPAGLRGLVPKDVYEAIAELGTFFRELCSRNLRIDVVKRLKEQIPLILCKLEKIFPPAFFDVMVHLCVHLPDEALLRGPVQYGWMYPIERRLCTLKNFVRNRAKPEGSIAEAYVASDTLTFCSRYMEDMDTRFNSEDDSGGEVPLPDDISVFQHGVTLVGGSRVEYIDDDVMDKLVWYVLHNCEEADEYKELYRDELLEQGAQVNNVDKMVEQGFVKWFRRHIENNRKENPDSVSEGLWALSRGPCLRVKFSSACKINGVRYSTADREKFLQTQNSGVMTPGEHNNNIIDFYGVLKELLSPRSSKLIHPKIKKPIPRMAPGVRNSKRVRAATQSDVLPSESETRTSKRLLVQDPSAAYDDNTAAEESNGTTGHDNTTSDEGNVAAGHDNATVEQHIGAANDNNTLAEAAEQGRPRRPRPPTVGKQLDRMTKAMGRRLPIVVQEGKRRPHEPVQAAKLASEAGVIVRESIPILPHWKDYKKDDVHYKTFEGQLAGRLAINTNHAPTKVAVTDVMRTAIKNQRYRLKKKYFNGVPANEIATTSPVHYMTDVEWRALVAKWSDPKNMKTCEKNKRNRNEVKYHQATGSRCYEAHLHAYKQKRNMEEPNLDQTEEVDAVEAFKTCHTSSKRGLSDPAREALSEMEALRDEPVPEGEMPASSVQVVSKVLAQNSSSQFLKSIGFQKPASSKSGSSNESELREQLAAEATAAVQGELDDLRKKIQDAEEEQARTQKELEEYKKITEKNNKEMAETNLLLKKLLSLQGNASSST